MSNWYLNTGRNQDQDQDQIEKPKKKEKRENKYNFYEINILSSFNSFLSTARVSWKQSQTHVDFW